MRGIDARRESPGADRHDSDDHEAGYRVNPGLARQYDGKPGEHHARRYGGGGRHMEEGAPDIEVAFVSAPCGAEGPRRERHCPRLTAQCAHPVNLFRDQYPDPVGAVIEPGWPRDVRAADYRPVPETIRQKKAVQAIKPSILTASTV